MTMRVIIGLFIIVSLFPACENDETNSKSLELLKIWVGGTEIDLDATTEGLPADGTITLLFSLPVNHTAAANSIRLESGQQNVEMEMRISSDGRTVVLYPAAALESNTMYTIVLSSKLQGSNGEPFSHREVRFKTGLPDLAITAVSVAGKEVTTTRITGAPLSLDLTLDFSAPVEASFLESATVLTGPDVPPLLFSMFNNGQTVTITTATPLRHLSKYQLDISETLEGALGESFAGFSKTIYTALDSTPKMPVVPDEELLTIVQQQTFRYFWDFAHPASGMARERDTSGEIVTTGGSGFGILSLIVGMERNFITREQGLNRMDKLLTFLENADRFHGAWPHWLNGDTGNVVPFSEHDNGADLVETSFLMQGLLTFRQYLNGLIPVEKSLIDRINVLWQAVEWDWFTRGGQDVLYWHWSPDKQWTMNHEIRGYNEALITYILAAASPSHPVAASVYHSGWARNGAIMNNKNFYGISLPLGPDYGGPLFFAHYSFLGLDPRNLQDQYVNYWTQNVHHSLINHAHAVANPRNYVGYSDANWGFTASDNAQGYAAHSPTNDLGVITPTAALSSFPYTPEQSMKALKFFYYMLGDRLWGPYGFYDAFDITDGWTADSYLAIDQGPIIVMIENYRTGLLWNLFMSSPEVKLAMDKLGFTR